MTAGIMKSMHLGWFVVMVLGALGARAAPSTYVCDYKTYGDANGLHKVGRPFILTFLLDASAKKAYLQTDRGSVEVRWLPQESGLTLVEITDVGNVMVTAITTNGQSVHSRTGILSGDIVPSQYYGSCTIR